MHVWFYRINRNLLLIGSVLELVHLIYLLCTTKSGVYSIYKGMTYKGDRGIYGQDSSWLTPAPPITVPRRDKEEKRKTDREGAAFRKEMRVTF